jgi:hypothetical protein
VEKHGLRLGIVNLISRDALRLADDPLAVLSHQLEAWGNVLDGVLVDFHGASTEEKLTVAFANAGRVTAVVGTHTHVPTNDAQVLPGGIAYVSDVGMTGPSGGILGYQPDKFVNAMRKRLYTEEPWMFAEGDVQLGAVLVTCAQGAATAIRRL